MREIVVIAILMSFSVTAFAQAKPNIISLTDEQYENIDIVHAELKKKDTNFVGLNGSQEKMEVIGISDKEALKVIAKIDFKKAREDKDNADPVKSARKTGIEKLKNVVGLTTEELKALGIGHG